MKSEAWLTAILTQYLGTEPFKPRLARALPYDLSLTLPFTKCRSPSGWQVAVGQAYPVFMRGGTLCRVPAAILGLGSRIVSRGLVMDHTLGDVPGDVVTTPMSGRPDSVQRPVTACK